MMKNYTLLAFCLSIYLTSFGQEVPETQQVVISKIGATWCPNCGLAAWDNFTVLHDDFGGKAVILSLHPSSSSSLHTPESKDLVDNLPQAFGQPLFYVNRTKYQTEEILTNTETAVSAAENVAPMANVGINAIIEHDNLVVDAKVKFFQAGDGDYFLSLLVVEDGVVANQSRRGSDAVHKKLLRTALLGGTFGQEITTGAVAANSEFTFSDTKVMAEGWNIDNLEIAAVIWQKVGDTYEVVNGNSVDVALSTSTNFLEATGVELSISPTILATDVTVTLSTPIRLTDAKIAIYTAAGQEMAVLATGVLEAGPQTFPLHRANLSTAGVYFLSLETSEGVLTRKVVVK
ncbi:MAG: Omp28-related outer membrane protein [Bacteroidota bacterium]